MNKNEVVMEDLKNLMFLFAVYGTLKRLKFFWPYLSNKNPKVGKGDSPLHFIAYYGLTDVADFMLKEFESVEDCLPTNHRGHTPLYYGSINGHSEIIRSLRRKIDFEIINPKWYEQSLYGAIIHGHFDCIKALLEKQTSEFKKDLANKIRKNHYLLFDKNPYMTKDDFFSFFAKLNIFYFKSRKFELS